MNKEIRKLVTTILIVATCIYLGLMALKQVEALVWLGNKKAMTTAIDQCMQRAQAQGEWNEGLYNKCMSEKEYK
jgi:hypothetical protein